MKYLLATFVFLISFSVITRSQTQVQVLNNAIKDIEKVEDRIRDNKILFEQVLKEGRVLEDLKTTKEAIIGLKKVVKDQPLSQDSLDNIKISVEALSELANKQTVIPMIRPTEVTALNIEETLLAQDLLEDIQAKAETGCLSNNMAFPVTVQTRNGNQDINNLFEIRYKNVTERNDDGNRFNGGALSPTSADLEAGVYYFWSQNPADSTKRGRKEKHIITCKTAGVSIFLQIP